LITTGVSGTDRQPLAKSITVKEYVADGIPDIEVTGPVPVVVIPLGFLVTAQLPEGRLLRKTVPVDNVQVGCEILSKMGVAGLGLTYSLAIFEMS